MLIGRFGRLLVNLYCLSMTLACGLLLLVLNERLGPLDERAAMAQTLAVLGLIAFLLVLLVLYAISLLCGVLIRKTNGWRGHAVLGWMHYLLALACALLGLAAGGWLLYDMPGRQALLIIAGSTLQMWWFLLWMLLQVWLSRQFLRMSRTA